VACKVGGPDKAVDLLTKKLSATRTFTTTTPDSIIGALLEHRCLRSKSRFWKDGSCSNIIAYKDRTGGKELTRRRETLLSHVYNTCTICILLYIRPEKAGSISSALHVH
jgi:hypothetical protein